MNWVVDPMHARNKPLQKSRLRYAILAALGGACLWGPAQAGVMQATVESGRQLAVHGPAASTIVFSPLNVHVFSGMDLGRQWEKVTRRALMPEFGEALGFHYEIDLGLLSNYEHLFLPGFVETSHSVPAANHLQLDFLAGRVLDTPLVSELSSQLMAHSGFQGLGIERQLFIPGIEHRFSDGGNINVAAVFAYQSFATPGMGSTLSSPALLPGESTAGTGVRLGFSSELAPGVEFGAAYQSRIEMDAFQSYRGVYSEPGDFDIPASANIGLVVRASDRASLSFDIERVLYSEVNSFTSSLLPDRFLSLLGDSSSPSFDWDDLTVYRVGWNFNSSEDLSWQVEYSTSQQPTPTSDALTRALSPEFADRNMSVGFSKRTGRNARVNFAASYAPSEYLLGNSAFGRQADLNDDQFEFEVIWIWDF